MQPDGRANISWHGTGLAGLQADGSDGVPRTVGFTGRSSLAARAVWNPTSLMLIRCRFSSTCEPFHNCIYLHARPGGHESHSGAHVRPRRNAKRFGGALADTGRHESQIAPSIRV